MTINALSAQAERVNNALSPADRSDGQRISLR
nr:MAG TPA: hypothetical protein [Caudoviricetes sp.]